MGLAGRDVDSPWERSDQYGELGLEPQPFTERTRLFVMAILLAPLKAIGALFCLISYFLCVKASILFPPSLRVAWVAKLGKIHCRAALFCFGFVRIRWIKVQDETAEGTEPKPAAVAYVSNHVSWVDTPLQMSRFFPAFVSRDSTLEIPLIGSIR